MQAVHGIARRHRLHGVDEAALQQVAYAVGRERLGAERLRGCRDAFLGGHDAHVEFELDVDPHAIFGDHRFLGCAADLDAQRAHVDLFDLVQERQRQTSAGDQDALAAESGTHQRDVARRFAIEAIEEHHRDRNHDGDNGNGKQPPEDDHVGPSSPQALRLLLGFIL